MASFGYLVILIDHHDESCCFTPRKNRTKDYLYFKGSYPHFQKSEMRDKLLFRHSELRGLIDLLESG